MPFDNTHRYFAFSPALLQSTDEMRDTLGDLASTAPNGNGEDVKTLLACVDHSEKGGLRALELGASARPTQLTDGRLCLGGLWAVEAREAFYSGAIDGEELTAEQVKNLIPTEEI